MVCSFALGGIERIEMLKENTLSINHTLNFRKIFEDANKKMDDYMRISSSRIDAFEIEIIESELIEETHVNIFSDHLHSNIPVENKISYYFIEK